MSIEYNLKTAVIFALATLLLGNAAIASWHSRIHAGVALLWVGGGALALYGFYQKQVNAFFATSIGRVILILLLIGLAVFAGLFVFVAASGYANNTQGDEKAIIVLGASLRGDNVSGVLERRLTKALEWHHQNPALPIVVTGGQGPDEAVTEAAAMKKWLVANGVPPSVVIEEDKSTSTEENLRFALPLLRRAGVTEEEPVAVVTNAFHCYRAGRYAAGVGYTKARTVPASMSVISLLPSYLREVLALLYMWLFRL